MRRRRVSAALVAAVLSLAGLPATALAASEGSLDTSFSGDGKLLLNFHNGMHTDRANDVALAPGGKIVLVGESNQGSNEEWGVARLGRNGTPDTSFSQDGRRWIGFSSFDVANSVAVQPDGKIIVVGRTQADDFAIVRLKANGALDDSFAGDGKRHLQFAGGNSQAKSVALQEDGRIVVAGYASGAYGFARLLSNGQLDKSFGGDGKQVVSIGANDFLNDMVIRGDGSIVAAGYTGNFDWGFAALDANGQPDTSFSGDGETTISFDPSTGFEQPTSLAVDPTNPNVIYAVGSESSTGNGDFAIARLKHNGQPDSGFSADGKRTFGFNNPGNFDTANGVAVQPDGKPVVVGLTDQGASGDDFGIARLKTNGGLDKSFSGDGKRTLTFNPGTAFDEANGVVIQNSTSLIVAGQSDPDGPFRDDFAVGSMIWDKEHVLSL